jgi:NAD(P)-dependent dehydrogenase (short-subunit alcohol dehydrogenase family)
MRIRDSVAFVTGANRGLGLAFAHELLAAGARAAFWNYLTGPFVFARPDVQAKEIAPWQENGEIWRRLAGRSRRASPITTRIKSFTTTISSCSDAWTIRRTSPRIR